MKAGSLLRRPEGPTASRSEPCPASGARNPRSARTCTPRGPTRSPHALSRGKAALSASATRAPDRASTSAAMLPAWPRHRPPPHRSEDSPGHHHRQHGGAGGARRQGTAAPARSAPAVQRDPDRARCHRRTSPAPLRPSPVAARGRAESPLAEEEGGRRGHRRRQGAVPGRRHPKAPLHYPFAARWHGTPPSPSSRPGQSTSCPKSSGASCLMAGRLSEPGQALFARPASDRWRRVVSPAWPVTLRRSQAARFTANRCSEVLAEVSVLLARLILPQVGVHFVLAMTPVAVGL